MITGGNAGSESNAVVVVCAGLITVRSARAVERATWPQLEALAKGAMLRSPEISFRLRPTEQREAGEIR